MLPILLLSLVFAADVSWQKVSVTLFQIQTDPDYELVCGVNTASQIYCSKTSSIAWYPFGGDQQFKQVTLAKGALYALTWNNQIFYSPSAINGQITWSLIPSPSLSQISFDGKTLCGATSSRASYCSDQSSSGAPIWYMIPGRMKQIVVHGDRVFGIRPNMTVVTSTSWKNATSGQVWTRVEGSLSSIEYDGSVLAGIQPNGDVVAATIKLDSTPNWEKIDGNNMTVITVGGGGKLFGLNSNGDIFTGKFVVPGQPSAA